MVVKPSYRPAAPWWDMVSRSKTARTVDGPLAGARVLVVDDHSFTIGLIKDVLYASGAHSVHSALDGAEAIVMLRLCQPHLVVTDWRMPGMDGLAFTEIVRRAQLKPDPRIPDPQVPIVLLSAHASTATVEMARRVGVSEVVGKPFTIAALLERIVAAATRPRDFVACEAYVGPDRRRRQDANPIVGRRASDQTVGENSETAASSAGRSALKRLQRRLDAVDRKTLDDPAKTTNRASRS
jgi:CheY-like chemotaxis protein